MKWVSVICFTYLMMNTLNILKQQGTRIHNNSSHLLSVVESKALETESYIIFEAFRKPAVTHTYHPLDQADLDSLSFQGQQNLHNKPLIPFC